MILICYDGSADAKQAIEVGGRLLTGQEATVLVVWESFAEVAARTAVGIGLVPSVPDPHEIDQATAQEAGERAQEGARLARDAGLEAEPRISARQTSTARAILHEAAEIDASAIVMGSRGLTGLKSLLLGSVSHAVIQEADRTVIVVPSSAVAASRASQRQEREDIS